MHLILVLLVLLALLHVRMVHTPKAFAALKQQPTSYLMHQKSTPHAMRHVNNSTVVKG
jgi:hypothetical protein